MIGKETKWEAEREKIAEMAKTMTSLQIAQSYETSMRQMQAVLSGLGIKPTQARVDWASRKDEVAEAAKTMTIPKMAEFFGINYDRMRAACVSLGIETIKSPHHQGKSEAYKEKLRKLGQTMTSSQIAEAIGGDQWHTRTYMRKHGIQFVENSVRPAGFWPAEKDKLAQMVGNMMTTTEIAKKYGVSRNRICGILANLGIKVKKRANVKEKKQVKKVELKPVIKKTTEPKQTKTFSFEKKPVQIVFPESVKIQVIKPNTCNDWRNAMARPTLSSFKETSWRY